MSLLKRLSTTLVAQVDQLVTGIENHDAVIGVAIRDARQATARAKVRLSRLRTERERIETKITETEAAQEKWTERARQFTERDEETALKCLQHRDQLKCQLEGLQQRLRQFRQMETRVQQDIRVAEKRIAEMNDKRKLLRTRESAASALGALSRLDEVQTNSADETFDRWEMCISESEYELDSASAFAEDDDDLERELVDTERRERLRAELAELKKEAEHE